MADCEAEERILRATFAIEQMAGTWVIDLGKLKQILTGTEECHHDHGA
jgi:hypothetical protein